MSDAGMEADFDPFDMEPRTMGFKTIDKGPYAFRELTEPMQRTMDALGTKLEKGKGDDKVTIDVLCKQIELMLEGAKEDGLAAAFVAGWKSGNVSYPAILRAHGKLMQWNHLAETVGNG